MDSPLTLLSVRSLLEYDHKQFINGVKFSKSNAENLDSLVTIVTYFRTQVIPLYQDFSQKISAKCTLLEDKHNYLLDDLGSLKDGTENLVKNFKRLSEKFDVVKNKQLNLLDRAENVIFEAKNRHNILSEAETQFSSDLEKVKSRIEDFHKDIEATREKKKVVEDQEGIWDSQSDKYFLNDWQIKIIRDSLFIMGLQIEQVLNNLLSLEVSLNNYDETKFLVDDI